MTTETSNSIDSERVARWMPPEAPLAMPRQTLETETFGARLMTRFAGVFMIRGRG
ncbi:hypothetical protein SAMN05421688_0569 [Poseidonocella pacifica]|uniref:Uncharacterized protein n=1 Tax=Poseidonocella pacifica TaxID=871651 RepID=A0A1I0VEY9_9RHOB|nr:hypothetical protein SAMN05421688_0569 [Poseidonocella pacifica]